MRKSLGVLKSIVTGESSDQAPDTSKWEDIAKPTTLGGIQSTATTSTEGRVDAGTWFKKAQCAPHRPPVASQLSRPSPPPRASLTRARLAFHTSPRAQRASAPHAAPPT